MSGPMQKMLDGGFIQAIRMCTDKLGFRVDPRVVTSQEVAVATAPIASPPIGDIAPGQVAARRFHWEAQVDGEPVVRITVNWLMGEENLDPPHGLSARRGSATRWRYGVIPTSPSWCADSRANRATRWSPVWSVPPRIA